MPIVEKTKYQTSNGKIFDNERLAVVEQNKINANELGRFNSEVYNRTKTVLTAVACPPIL